MTAWARPRLAACRDSRASPLLPPPSTTVPSRRRHAAQRSSGRSIWQPRRRCRPPAAGRTLRDWAGRRDAPRPLGGWESMEEEEDSDEDLDLFPEEVRFRVG